MKCHCCQSDEVKKQGRYQNKNRTVQRFQCLRCGKSFSESQPLDGLRVDFAKACQVVHLLCESMGIRAIERITGLNRRTVLNILETAGQKASAYMDAHIRNVTAFVVQADEIHTIVFSKQQNTPDEETERGEQFTFLSVDKRSKLILNWHIGKRTRENAERFLTDLKNRMANRFQLVTDNWRIYSDFGGSVRAVFGEEVDYATETKVFQKPPDWTPRRLVAVKRRSRIGEPDMALATTCHAERTNLSVRLFQRRFTRCTLGYSKTLANLKYSVALFVWHFNFCRIHSAHNLTPAFVAGVAKSAEPMTIAELLAYQG